MRRPLGVLYSVIVVRRHFRIKLCITNAICTLVVAGCAPGIPTDSDKPQDIACAMELELPAKTENCAGSLDVSYAYANPKLDAHIPMTIITNKSLDRYYTPQDAPNHCYAAALSIGFKALGYHYPQSLFVHAANSACIGVGEMPLTFSQIVFAATKVHLVSGGIWYIDTPDEYFTKLLNRSSGQPASYSWSSNNTSIYHRNWVCKAADENAYSYSWTDVYMNLDMLVSNLIKWHDSTIQISVNTQANPQSDEALNYLLNMNLYHPVLWSHSGNPDAPQGGIVPIRNTDDLVNRFQQGAPVLAGLRTGPFGHVVVVRGIAYRAEVESKDAVNLGTHIDWVEVLDPARPDDPMHKIDGSTFITSARFIFALYQPS